METPSRGNYVSIRDWFTDALRDENAILCRTSAMECHGLFSGYFNEREI